MKLYLNSNISYNEENMAVCLDYIQLEIGDSTAVIDYESADFTNVKGKFSGVYRGLFINDFSYADGLLELFKKATSITFGFAGGIIKNVNATFEDDGKTYIFPKEKIVVDDGYIHFKAV